MESPEAHELFFKHNSTLGFMNMSQIDEISNTKNCFIAVHGHKHLNLVEARKEGIKTFVKKVVDDYTEMFEITMSLIYSGTIRNQLMFVLPYINMMN